jgi:branched-chain amino acid transport system ATP-binding protein
MDALGRRSTIADALGNPLSRFAERATMERARAILHVLELDTHANSRAGDLPAGTQRRVEIARALAMKPKLILLDEPAAGLDAGETKRLADLLNAVRERFHVSMLLVDHDMSLVMRVCDYMYVLDFGKILAQGKPAEIRSDRKVIAAYLGEPNPELTPSEPDGAAQAVVAPVERNDGAQAVPTGAPLLGVKGVAAGYGPLEVIRDVNLYVRPAEIVACIGANGAGKTTTLRAISGIVKPRAGQVFFGGKEITGRTPEHIAVMGLAHIPEGRGLFPRMSVEDTLLLASDNTGQRVDPGVAYDVFPRLKQRRWQAVGTLSGGEQQMVALARALLARPRLVMVDEMSQGLAPTIVRQLFEMLSVLRIKGIAVLLVEQFVESALDVADRAYIFEHGTVSHEAPAAELRADRKLISGSYLGSAGDETLVGVSANGNGHKVDVELMEILSMKVPPSVKRAIEERAVREGRSAGAIALELLEGVKQ